MVAMGFLIVIGAAFLLLLAVAGILFVGFCALTAGGVGFWWWRSRKAKANPTADGSAPKAGETVGDQDSRSGR
jgi:hypothetical protein